jgi:hypothetical protein
MPIEDLEEKRSRINHTALKYFGIFMALAWLILGILIVSLPNGLLNITAGQKTLVGILFSLYGLYRAFKVYWQYFRKRA